MIKVKPEPFRAYQRACLPYMLSEDIPHRGVYEMCCCMMPACCLSRVQIRDYFAAVSGGNTAFFYCAVMHDEVRQWPLCIRHVQLKAFSHYDADIADLSS